MPSPTKLYLYSLWLTAARVRSQLIVNLLPGGMSKGGDINITTESLAVTNGAELITSTLGEGDAGSVHIQARDRISFDGVGSNGFATGAFSAV